MTRTRLSTTAIRRRATPQRAEQESWSDVEDSLGYQVSYPSATTTTPVSAPPAAKAPAEEDLVTIGMFGLLTKVPMRLVRSATAEKSQTKPVG